MSKTDDGMHKIKCHAKKGYVKVVKWVEMKRERTRPLPRVKSAQFLGVGLRTMGPVDTGLVRISQSIVALSFQPSLILF